MEQHFPTLQRFILGSFLPILLELCRRVGVVSSKVENSLSDVPLSLLSSANGFSTLVVDHLLFAGRSLLELCSLATIYSRQSELISTCLTHCGWKCECNLAAQGLEWSTTASLFCRSAVVPYVPVLNASLALLSMPLIRLGENASLTFSRLQLKGVSFVLLLQHLSPLHHCCAERIHFKLSSSGARWLVCLCLKDLADVLALIQLSLPEGLPPRVAVEDIFAPHLSRYLERCWEEMDVSGGFVESDPAGPNSNSESTSHCYCHPSHPVLQHAVASVSPFAEGGDKTCAIEAYIEALFALWTYAVRVPEYGVFPFVFELVTQLPQTLSKVDDFLIEYRPRTHSQAAQQEIHQHLLTLRQACDVIRTQCKVRSQVNEFRG